MGGGKGGGGSAPITMPQQQDNSMEMMMPMMQMMMEMSMQNNNQPAVPEPVPQPDVIRPEDMTTVAPQRSWQEVANDLKVEAETTFDETQDGTYQAPETPPTLEDEDPDTTESLLG